MEEVKEQTQKAEEKRLKEMKRKSQKVYRCQNCNAVCQACFGRRDSGLHFDKPRSQTHKELTKKIKPSHLVESKEDTDSDLESVSDMDPMVADKKTISNSNSIPIL